MGLTASLLANHTTALRGLLSPGPGTVLASSLLALLFVATEITADYIVGIEHFAVTFPRGVPGSTLFV